MTAKNAPRHRPAAERTAELGGRRTSGSFWLRAPKGRATLAAALGGSQRRFLEFSWESIVVVLGEAKTRPEELTALCSRQPRCTERCTTLCVTFEVAPCGCGWPLGACAVASAGCFPPRRLRRSPLLRRGTTLCSRESRREAWAEGQAPLFLLDNLRVSCEHRNPSLLCTINI